jgi:hypothetical protein
MKNLLGSKIAAVLLTICLLLMLFAQAVPASAHGTRDPVRHTHTESWGFYCALNEWIDEKVHSWPSPYFRVWDSLSGTWYYHMHLGDYGWDDKGHYVGSGSNYFYYNCY